MSFALDIKKEILEREFSVEDAKSFIEGLVLASGITEGSITTIRINNVELSETIRIFCKELAMETAISRINKNFIEIKNYHHVDKIKFSNFFFGGAFLGGGSISDSNSTSYHLEIQVYSQTKALKLQSMLNQVGVRGFKRTFNFQLIQRRAMWVLYIKKSEMISDFLKVIEAQNAVLHFEDLRIQRDFNNQMTRFSNFDFYNQERLVNATDRFKIQYKWILENGHKDQFSKEELDFFQLKMKHPFYSLETLANMFNNKFETSKTRGGLNHWIIKLRKIYDESNS